MGSHRTPVGHGASPAQEPQGCSALRCRRAPVLLAPWMACCLLSCETTHTTLLVNPEAVREFCDRYVAVLAPRLVDCYGGEPAYLVRNISHEICPATFSRRDTVALSVEFADECIKSIATWNCGEKRSVACRSAIVGQGGRGAECSTDLGCAADFECSGPCGRCRRIPSMREHGQACAPIEGLAACMSGQDCADYGFGRHYCSQVLGAECERFGFCGPDASCYEGRCRRKAEVGGGCSSFRDCAAHLECNSVGMGRRECMMGAALGAQCTESSVDCAGYTGACDEDNGICQPFPANGAPCLRDGTCEAWSTCDYDGTMLCHPLASLGEPCNDEWLWCREGECSRGVCREPCAR